MTRIASTPDGRRIEVRERVAAPRDRVWETFRDTETWAGWGPSVRAVDSPTRYIERGTEGRVQTVAGIWLPFEIQDCVPYRWTWDVANLPATGHRVGAAADGCVAVIEVSLLAAAYAPVCRRGLAALARLVE